MHRGVIILFMRWIHHYQLFLFDFDGILVNTEHFHYKAYLKMCEDRGFTLNWNERTYIRHAMHTATGLKEGIYRTLPNLEKEEPSWEVLYKEKKKVYYELLLSEGVSLMPGVETLLLELENANIKRAVVTHSPSEQIALIRQQQPLLNSIPVWITREDYSQPKPSPECYWKAISKLHVPGERVIGFEDSPRGLKALLGTLAEGVFITDCFEPSEITELANDVGKDFSHFPSFPEMFLQLE
jgi:beta-phosphoglucomutase